MRYLLIISTCLFFACERENTPIPSGAAPAPYVSDTTKFDPIYANRRFSMYLNEVFTYSDSMERKALTIGELQVKAFMQGGYIMLSLSKNTEGEYYVSHASFRRKETTGGITDTFIYYPKDLDIKIESTGEYWDSFQGKFWGTMYCKQLDKTIYIASGTFMF